MHAAAHCRRSRCRYDPAPEQAATERRGMFRRILDAMARSRQRRAEREIASALGLTSGRLTDEIERRLMENFTRSRNFHP